MEISPPPLAGDGKPGAFIVVRVRSAGKPNASLRLCILQHDLANRLNVIRTVNNPGLVPLRTGMRTYFSEPVPCMSDASGNKPCLSSSARVASVLAALVICFPQPLLGEIYDIRREEKPGSRGAYWAIGRPLMSAKCDLRAVGMFLIRSMSFGSWASQKDRLRSWVETSN